jgi:hypothetical protein
MSIDSLGGDGGVVYASPSSTGPAILCKPTANSLGHAAAHETFKRTPSPSTHYVAGESRASSCSSLNSGLDAQVVEEEEDTYEDEDDGAGAVVAAKSETRRKPAKPKPAFRFL